MAKFVIEGGYPLRGEVIPQGAKNEALQVIAAVLLTTQQVTISHIPDIRDVNKLIELLELLGVKTEEIQVKPEGRTICFDASEVSYDKMESVEYCKSAAALRGSILLAGPMLARFGKAFVPQPGGDKIGRRRMDTHYSGFEQLGAKVEFVHRRSEGIQGYLVDAQEGLRSAEMLLDEASVTGTANLVMAAVMAKGISVIMNAACEPYVYQLCHMLNSMGAKINGVMSNRLVIQGVSSLRGTAHCLLPDMIEVGSFIGMAAMTHGELTIRNASVSHLGLIPKVFRRLGIEVWQRGDDLFIPEQEHYEIERFRDGSIMTIADAPWPGFTPDLISIALVVATQAKGSVLIHQKMFESRLFFVDKLIDMGAQIILCDPHRAVVIGHDHQTQLVANNMTSPDIRAGIALLIAAMSAKGVSKIDHIDQIDRGYEDIENRLNAIGAHITRVD